MEILVDRRDAGRRLGELLASHHDATDTVVLALPRGGVPVAYEIASRLELPLDVLVVRKIGVPGQAELAMGAVAVGGVTLMNEPLASSFGAAIKGRAIRRELDELERRQALYRNGRMPLSLEHLKVIIVDDGAATGASVRAAIRAARRLGADKVIVALPVASPDAMCLLEQEADEVVCLLVPAEMNGVGDWYEDFPQISDEEVMTRLVRSRCARARKANSMQR